MHITREFSTRFPVLHLKFPTAHLSLTNTSTMQTQAASHLESTQLEYQKLYKEDLKYLIHGKHEPALNEKDIIFTEGHAATLRDSRGNEYIDCLAGLFTTIIGHGRQEVASQQITKLQFTQTLAGYSNPEAIKLAKKMIQIAHHNGLPHMSQAFFCLGGSEANESAFHLALRYSEKKGHMKKVGFISFNNCYHGATFMAASVNPMRTSKYGWNRITHASYSGMALDRIINPFISIDFPNGNFFDNSKLRHGENLGQCAARLLEEAILANGPENICGFIFEPMQGDGGAVTPHPDFFPLAQEICNRYDVLMIADEVLTFGKTGKWFCVEHWNVQPDLVTVAKGITSGYLPLGAVLVSDKIRQVCLDTDDAWEHDFTYTGHPTCCAVALRNLEIMEQENLIEQSSLKGDRLLISLTERLFKYSNVVKEIRGQGLVIGIQLNGAWAAEVEQLMAHEQVLYTRTSLTRQKVIVHASSNKLTVNMCPPAVITDEQIEKVVQGFEAVFSKLNTDKQPQRQ